MLNLIQQYAAELIASLAVIVSVAANWRAVRAERKIDIAQSATRRADMLVELERKNAAVGKLALISARKLLLIQQNPGLEGLAASESERLKNNLELMKEFKACEETQRNIAEKAGCGANVDLYHQAFADVKRLRVSLEAEVEKEASVFESLADQVSHRVSR